MAPFLLSYAAEILTSQLKLLPLPKCDGNLSLKLIPLGVNSFYEKVYSNFVTLGAITEKSGKEGVGSTRLPSPSESQICIPLPSPVLST